MHCSRGGHDRVEMFLVEDTRNAGTQLLRCPECGREEKQHGKLASETEHQPDPPQATGVQPVRRLVDSVVEWWDDGEPLKVLGEMLSDLDTEHSSPRNATPPKLQRNSVTIDRSRGELRVGEGPAIRLSEAEVLITRRPVKPPSFLDTPIGRVREKWIF